jgi:hypothetical protein
VAAAPGECPRPCELELRRDAQQHVLAPERGHQLHAHREPVAVLAERQRHRRLAAWAVRSALHGFAALEITAGNPASLDLDATFRRLVSLFVAGLENWDDVARRPVPRSAKRA